MATIDMSDVLLDPDFLDPAVCTRSVETVGTNGIATRATTNTNFYGAFMSEGRWIQRGADWQRVQGSITCITTFALSDGSRGQTADVVVWAGRSYTVSNVNDMTNYGTGFVEATCDLLPLSGGPDPTATPTTN